MECAAVHDCVFTVNDSNLTACIRPFGMALDRHPPGVQQFRMINFTAIILKRDSMCKSTV